MVRATACMVGGASATTVGRSPFSLNPPIDLR
jgi:hypothetical protein